MTGGSPQHEELYIRKAEDHRGRRCLLASSFLHLFAYSCWSTWSTWKSTWQKCCKEELATSGGSNVMSLLGTVRIGAGLCTQGLAAELHVSGSGFIFFLSFFFPCWGCILLVDSTEDFGNCPSLVDLQVSNSDV